MVVCALIVGTPVAYAATTDDIRAELLKLQAQLQVLLQKVNASLPGGAGIIQFTPPPSPAAPAKEGYVTLEEVEGNPRVSCVVSVMKPRTSGAPVSLLQLLLTQEGSYPEGLITGYYGKLTQAAIERFQASRGLEQTGHVDPATAKAASVLAQELFPESCGRGNDEGRLQCEYAQPPQGCAWVGSVTYPDCSAQLMCDEVDQSGIIVTAPVAGEVWRMGEKHEIGWTTNDPTMRPMAGSVAITLHASRAACLEGEPPCLVSERAPYTIATQAPDIGSYVWVVGRDIPSDLRGESVEIVITRTKEPRLRGSSGVFTIDSMTPVAEDYPGACMPWVNAQVPAIHPPDPTNLSISPLHLFSFSDASLSGEGSFVTLADGRTVFIYSAFPEWAGDRQLMVVRQIKAAKGTGAKVILAKSKKASVFIASKLRLNVEHCTTLPIGYQSQLSDLAKQGGELQTVELVHYQDVTINASTVKFSGSDVESVSDITMTTGGSVYLITVYGKDQAPLLNVVSDARARDGKALIEKAQAVLQSAKGDGMKTIVGQSPHYEDPIYTFAGVRKGYTVFTSQLTVNGDAVAVNAPAALLADLTAAVLRLGTVIHHAR
jgi:hypothetical protein